MAPTGLDKLLLAWRVLLGLVVNLVLVGLPLFAAGVVLAIVLYRPGHGDLAEGGAEFSANPPSSTLWILAGSIGAAVALGVGSLMSRPKRDGSAASSRSGLCGCC
jgi:hypothetical protein